MSSESQRKLPCVPPKLKMQIFLRQTSDFPERLLNTKFLKFC